MEKTWQALRESCLGTFLGGYTGDGDEAKLAAFRRGVNTVFNILQDRFPEPHQIQARENRDKLDGALFYKGLPDEWKRWLPRYLTTTRMLPMLPTTSRKGSRKMPLKWFTCPDGERIEYQKCLVEGGCRMNRRCAVLPYLHMVAEERRELLGKLQPNELPDEEGEG